MSRNFDAHELCEECKGRDEALAKQGLLVWVSSSSSAGGTPPYLSPYFAAKAAMDALAVQYARELSRWGIETSIIVPGAFTSGTNHFAHSGKPFAEELACASSSPCCCRRIVDRISLFQKTSQRGRSFSCISSR